ncbi:hypothetical protein EJ04DRAFT_561121 [Polyplosphaeria fusca]|uniref:Uncharacterized protein n=1 Tax=Polyplosphaeria fusca TaxID=682080 RepID=A0A9P4R2I4_9PLEO|nr:hypothetical protein EJ04DRAFT_561121 [Polyplosphaeria fusca]
MTTIENTRGCIEKIPFSFLKYSEYKDWVTKGGLQQFRDEHGLGEDFLEELSSLPTEVIGAYISTLDAIPGLRARVEDEFRRSCREQTAEVHSRRMYQAMKLAGDGSSSTEDEDNDTSDYVITVADPSAGADAGSTLSIKQTYKARPHGTWWKYIVRYYKSGLSTRKGRSEKNLELSEKNLELSEKNLELSEKNLELSEKNLELSEKNLGDFW